VPTKNPFLYFDIETGDLSAEKAPVLSISYARGEERQSFYAAAPEGSYISDWARENVQKPIESRLGTTPTETEESVLRRFLGVLEGHRGGTIAGWNIGYTPVAQAKGVKGLDIPFLISRAEKYGIGKEYQAAFSGVKIRDIGREFSVRIAQEVTKYPELVDPKLHAQAKSFTKLIDINTATQRLNTVAEQAEWMGGVGAYRGYEVAGWKLKDIYSRMFGDLTGHHLSDADVEATRQIAEHGDLSKIAGPEFVSSWNTIALQRKAEATARANLSGGLGEKITRRAGALIGETSSLWRSATVAGKVLRDHKVGIGIGLGLAALWAIKPLQYFSGKDDEYNTIEGLRHGGQAQRKRKELTDFGSGWVRRALSMGIAPERVASASKALVSKEATSPIIRKLASIGEQTAVPRAMGLAPRMGPKAGLSRTYEVMSSDEGMKWLVGRQMGEGGFGKVSEAFQAGTGKAGIYKHIGEAKALPDNAFIVSPAFKETLIDDKLRVPFTEKFALPTSEGFARTANRYGGMGAVHEATMQKMAHAQYGSMVPEVYGTTKTGIFMESAGRPLSDKEALEGLKWLQGKWIGQISKVAKEGEERVYHLDPQLMNIMKKGKEYKLIDWGVSTTEHMGREAVNIAEEAYEGYIQRTAQELNPQQVVNVVKPPVALPKTGINHDTWVREHKKAAIMSSVNARNGGKRHTSYVGTSDTFVRGIVARGGDTKIR
jgi:hypothetical protein